MAVTINTNKGTYSYTDKSGNTVTKSIKGGVNSSQAQQLNNAVSQAQSRGQDRSISNDTSGYYRQGGTGNLMYNGKAAIDNMYGDNFGNTVIKYSDGSYQYKNQQGENIDASTYKAMMNNNNALGLNKSVQGLSSTYNYSNTNNNVNSNGINPNIYTPAKNIALGGYQFGTAAELAEKNSPGYQNQRNQEIAKLLSDNGIYNKEGIGQYLSQYSDFTNYDISGQTATIDKIYNEIMRAQNQNQQPELQEINLNNPFMQTVDSILKSAYGIDSVDAIKDMYGAENYYNLMNALKDVEGTWNATDPASRAQLQGQLQEIIGAVVGTGVDQSKLNLNMEAVLSQFTPQARQQIEQDVLAVQNLQTKGYSVEQIAKQTGMSKDQVNQLVLLNQGLPSQIGKYYDLNNETEEFITEDYERARDNLMENYKWNMEQVNQQLDQIKQDFNKTYLDQQEANENTLHNMDLIAGMTGTGYSRRGLEGMSYAQQQANAVLNNLLDNYDRSNLEIANSIKSLTMAYQQSDAELVDQMNDAIMNAKNNYITQVSNIQAKYGLVGLEGQQAIAQAVQGFVNQAETIYNNAFNRAWTNTNNLISAVSNIGALEQQQIQTRQMKIAEFQQDSMYMTQSQIADYAQKNGLQMSYDQLVGYQQEATINTLNSISPGLGNKYANQIKQKLANGYTPQQAVSEILNSPEVQGSVSGDRAISGDYMYDKNTGEVRLLSDMVSGGNGMGSYNTQAIQQEIANYSTQWTGQYTEGQQINKQCGAFVNDYLESMGLGRVFTDPIEKKAAAINSDTPTVGSVVVMTSPTQPKYGHVGIVKSIDYNTGKMTIAQTNYNGDGAYHESTISMNSNKILGYYDPAVAMAGQGGTTQQQNTQVTGYDETMTGYYNKFLSAKMTKDDWTHVGDENEFKQMALNYRNKINSQVTDVADTMLYDMIELRNWLKNGGTMTGLRLNIATTNAHKYRSMYEQIKSSDALQNLINLKANGATFGALSDQELGFITDASNRFNIRDNEKNFTAELDKKINKILNQYGMSEQQFVNSKRGSGESTTTTSGGSRGNLN